MTQINYFINFRNCLKALLYMQLKFAWHTHIHIAKKKALNNAHT